MNTGAAEVSNKHLFATDKTEVMFYSSSFTTQEILLPDSRPQLHWYIYEKKKSVRN